MDEKRCPYCGGVVKDDFCSHCGAAVAPDQQLDPDQAPELPPVETPPGGWGYEEKVPWERMDELGFWSALAETVKEILATPEDFFSRLSPSGGYGGPLLYGLLLGVAGVIVSQVWSIIGSAIGFGAMGMLGSQFGEVAAQQAGIIMQAIIGIMISLILVPVMLFISSGVIHLMLMILGGANEDYEATFRCVAFAQTAQLAQIIPVVGGLIAAIWTIVLEVKALANIHDISAGKALLAILLPGIVCCVIIGGFVAIFGIGMMGALGSMGGGMGGF